MFRNPKYPKWEIEKSEITTMRAMKFVNANYLVFYIHYIHLFIYESMNKIYTCDI